MLKDEDYYWSKKMFIQVKISCEKSRGWENADQKKIDEQIKSLDETWGLIEKKYEDS